MPGTNIGRVVCAWAVAVTVTAPSGNVSSSGSTQVYLILYLELGPHGAQRNAPRRDSQAGGMRHKDKTEHQEARKA